MEEATCWERRAPRAAIGLDEGVADSAGGRAGARPSQGRSDRRYVHVEAGQLPFMIAGAWRHVSFLLEHLTVHALQVDIETPEPVQVLEHALGGLAQRLALMALVTQGQWAVMTAIHFPDLDVVPVLAEIGRGTTPYAHPTMDGISRESGAFRAAVMS